MTLIMALLGEESPTVYVLPPPTTKRGAVASSPFLAQETKSTSVTSLTDLADRTAALPIVTLS